MFQMTCRCRIPDRPLSSGSATPPTRAHHLAVGFSLSNAAIQTLKTMRRCLRSGCGSDPEKFEDESQMDDRASRYLYYTAYPRGSTSQLTPETQLECLSGGGRSCGWNAGLSPGSCQTPTNPAPDDVFFAETVLEWMEQNLCVDMDRVFISGFSNGGQVSVTFCLMRNCHFVCSLKRRSAPTLQMAYKLNCELSERFAGVATNGMTPGAAYTPGAPTCMPTRQLPAINFCGSTDFVNCYGTDGSTIRTQVESFGRANGARLPPPRAPNLA
eukprot:SAG31_NODE_552_length_14204_cov_14.295356_3_plen_270_part_00